MQYNTISLFPKLTLFTFEEAAELFPFLANRCLELSLQEIERKGQFSFAFAGGSTPEKLYQHLASLPIPWKQWQVFFGDERTVSPESEESNFNMAKRALLHLAPKASYFRLRGEASDLNAEAKRYEQLLQNKLPLHKPSNIPIFDLILLGVGSDGHTASLFPATKALTEKHSLVVSNKVQQKTRLTFTFPLLNQAKQIWILSTGAGKSDILADIFQTYAQKRYPIQYVQPMEGEIFWFSDREASQKLILKENH